MPQDPNDKTKVLYDAVSKDYDIGTYDEFTSKLSDPTKREAFFNGVGAEYDLGDYETFSRKLGYDSKETKQKLPFVKTAQETLSQAITTQDELPVKQKRSVVPVADIFSNKPIKESVLAKQPMETLEQDAIKAQAKEVEKQRKRDLLPAYENSADLYFKNNGIKPTKAQREAKIIELQRDYGNGGLVLGYDKSGKPRMERELTGFDAFWKGAKEGLKMEGEARKFIDLGKDEQIKLMNDEFSADNEYLPTNTEYTVTGGLGRSLGQGSPTMGKAITGAVVGAGLEAVSGGTATPALPAVMSFLFSAPSAANVAYMEELKRRYYEGKQMGMTDDEAYDKASQQALVGGAKSLVTDVFFSKIPATKASGEGLNNAINQYIKSGAKTSGEFAGVSGATTLGSELSAKAQGFNQDESIGDIIEKSGKDAVDAAIMGSALHIISHPEIFVTLPKYLQAQYKGYLSKSDKGQLNEVFNEMVEKGMATEEGIAAAQKELQSFEQAGKKVSGEFDETRENVIKGLVEKKLSLEKKKTEVDDSFHDDIDAQIESVNNRIKAAKNADNPLSVEVDDVTGNSLRNVKDFSSLSNKEIVAVSEIVPKEYGNAEVIEVGEGENKTFKPKATVIVDKGGLPISDNIKIEDEGKKYTSKEAAQKAADKALAQHYYDNKMDEASKPEQKSSVTVIRPEQNKAPEIVENVKAETQPEIPIIQTMEGSRTGNIELQDNPNGGKSVVYKGKFLGRLGSTSFEQISGNKGQLYDVELMKKVLDDLGIEYNNPSKSIVSKTQPQSHIELRFKKPIDLDKIVAKNETKTQAQEPNIKTIERVGTGNEPVSAEESSVAETIIPETTRPIGEEQAAPEKPEIIKLNNERGVAIKGVMKESSKLNFIPSKELVKAKDPLEAKAKHDKIISNYKSLRKLIDCL